MSKLAIVFAGQGSQYLGMGLDFLENNHDLKAFEKQADHILGYHSKEIISSDLDKLNQTEWTQPLIFLSTIYAFETLKRLNVKFEGLLGFSLGEYAALYASSILNFEQAIQLLMKRGKLMNQETQKNPGTMAAILGLSVDDILALCQKYHHQIFPANFNSPVQTVVSGYEDHMDAYMTDAKLMGAKRAVKLNVSGAFHSPLMKQASYQFKEVLNTMVFHTPKIPVVLNTTANWLEFDTLKEEMSEQISSPVRFTDSIDFLKSQGFTHFLEIGPGQVLSGLIKKIDVNLEVCHLEKLSDIITVEGWLKTYGFIK